MSSIQPLAATAEGINAANADPVNSDTPTMLATHPDYSSPEANVVLRSRDDVLFRVSSGLLRRTSGWLNAMFTLPQSPGSAANREEPIPMDEPSDLLAQLLSIADGRALPPVNPLDDLEPLLNAADKYEMPMVISVLRLALFSRLADGPPLRLYGIACRMNWLTEAEDASSRTLKQDLLAPEAQAELAEMAPRHRQMLLDLHCHRRDAFFAELDDLTEFYANNRGCACNAEDADNPCIAPLDHSHWWALKYALMQRWVKSPLGAELDEEFYCMPEWEDMSRAKCLSCGRYIYSMKHTIRKVNTLLGQLRRCIDWS